MLCSGFRNFGGFIFSITLKKASEFGANSLKCLLTDFTNLAAKYCHALTRCYTISRFMNILDYVTSFSYTEQKIQILWNYHADPNLRDVIQIEYFERLLLINSTISKPSDLPRKNLVEQDEWRSIVMTQSSVWAILVL